MVAVLFSSGIDSWACLNWAAQKYGSNNILPLYIDFGQSYAEKEIKHATKMCELLFTQLHVKTIMSDELLTENPVTKHVPFRNMFFIELAAIFEDVDTIVFGLVKGDWSEDKNPKFLHAMEDLLNSQLMSTIHRRKGSMTIVAPFAHRTKTQVVKWLIDNTHLGREGVRQTIGCYAVDETPCGQCISCFSRWVAFYLNGLSSEHADDVYVRWFASKLTGTNTHGTAKWEFVKLFWRKRAFATDAYKAINRQSKAYFHKSFINMYLFN